MTYTSIAGNWTTGNKQSFPCKETLYEVLCDDNFRGFITKFRNTRAETHPWKAYVGKGENAIYIGAFYEGKQYAIDAIARAYQQ